MLTFSRQSLALLMGLTQSNALLKAKLISDHIALCIGKVLAKHCSIEE